MVNDFNDIQAELNLIGKDIHMNSFQKLKRPVPLAPGQVRLLPSGERILILPKEFEGRAFNIDSCEIVRNEELVEPSYPVLGSISEY